MPQEKSNTLESPKRMSVLISQDGLSFYTCSNEGLDEHWEVVFENKLNPGQILKEIENEHETRPALKTQINSVSLFYHHDIFSLVPKKIFRADHAADYLKYNARLLKTDILSHDFINEEVLVYIAFENINNYFFEKYGSFNYFHYSSKILEQIGSKKKDNATAVFIEKIKAQFYLTIFKDGSLQAHNLFLCETNEDLLYYLMFSIQQNKLDPTELNLKILGSSIDDFLIELLKIYILQVSVDKDYKNHKKQLLCV
ncbi:MAG: DUF3822 family protein [Nonlabens sp.]